MKNFLEQVEKWKSILILVAMLLGVLIGHYWEGYREFISSLEIAGINILLSIVILILLLPTFVVINYSKFKEVEEYKRGITATALINWIVQPLSMVLIAWLYFSLIMGNVLDQELQQAYIQGAILLGAAPCTILVFLWSKKMKGNAEYTLAQVLLNDLILLIAYVPLVTVLLLITGVNDLVPIGKVMLTSIVSILIFVVLPITIAMVIKIIVNRETNKVIKQYKQDAIIAPFNFAGEFLLYVMVGLIFTMQSENIWDNPVHILIIAVPLSIQILIVYFIAFFTNKVLKIPKDVAGPSMLIAASNFFELALVVAIAIFGADSPVALATSVGILIEIPLMLGLVKITNTFYK